MIYHRNYIIYILFTSNAILVSFSKEKLTKSTNIRYIIKEVLVSINRKEKSLKSYDILLTIN